MEFSSWCTVTIRLSWRVPGSASLRLSYGSLRGTEGGHKCLMIGWFWRGRRESAGQTVGSRSSPEEEQEATLYLCPRKKKKKKNTSCQLDPSSDAPERRGGTTEDQDTILQHIAFPSSFISSWAVRRVSPWVTGSMQLSKSLYVSSRLRCARSQFCLRVLFVPLPKHRASGNFFLLKKKKKVYLLPKRKYGSLLLML